MMKFAEAATKKYQTLYSLSCDKYRGGSMSSLNVFCPICTEYFKCADIIFTTTRCGHVFHQQCLLRWLSRASTCPQCRDNCHRRIVRRLYLNFSEPTAVDEVDLEPIRSFEWFSLDDTMSQEEIAKFALKLDNDEEGNPIYAARVYLNDDLVPCYYDPKKKGVYCALDCKSHFIEDDFELLHIYNDDAEYKWVSSDHGEVPEKALATGYSETGETLYIARTLYKERVRYGKLDPSHGECYVPYKEAEANNRTCEVLVRIPKVDV